MALHRRHRRDAGRHGVRCRRAFPRVVAPLPAVEIFASGNLDEYKLRDLCRTAPIDGHGVGASLNPSASHPSLDCAQPASRRDGETEIPVNPP
jgi:nicotinate phosphoribosyltransferase